MNKSTNYKKMQLKTKREKIPNQTSLILSCFLHIYVEITTIFNKLLLEKKCTYLYWMSVKS